MNNASAPESQNGTISTHERGSSAVRVAVWKPASTEIAPLLVNRFACAGVPTMPTSLPGVSVEHSRKAILANIAVVYFGEGGWRGTPSFWRASAELRLAASRERAIL